jgi:hypothetical protein
MRTLDKVGRDKVSISGIVETLGKVENKSRKTIDKKNKNTVERLYKVRIRLDALEKVENYTRCPREGRERKKKKGKERRKKNSRVVE